MKKAKFVATLFVPLGMSLVECVTYEQYPWVLRELCGDSGKRMCTARASRLPELPTQMVGRVTRTFTTSASASLAGIS